MYYEILSASGGGYFFRIKGGNHEKIAHSEVYTAKSTAYDSIGVIQGGAATGEIVDNS